MKTFQILILLLCLMAVGCSSSEKVYKPKKIAAQPADGSVAIKSFKVNGFDDSVELSIEPGMKLDVQLRFVRTVPLDSSSFGVLKIVQEMRETETAADGSYLNMTSVAVTLPAGNGELLFRQTIEVPNGIGVSKTLKNSSVAYLVLAENQKEVASRKLLVVQQRE